MANVALTINQIPIYCSPATDTITILQTVDKVLFSTISDYVIVNITDQGEQHHVCMLSTIPSGQSSLHSPLTSFRDWVHTVQSPDPGPTQAAQDG